jgi:CBS domain-containing protein
MKIGEIMSRNVRTCQPTDSINQAAQIMWEENCGSVPVVDGDAKVVGIITDRDICMGAYTQGRPLGAIQVDTVLSKSVFTVRETDSLHHAEQLMHDAQVRRLPVLDADDRLVGIVSIGDFARRIPGEAGSFARTAGELKNELRKSLELLQTLRDDVRVRLHLGSRELRDRWNKLEPHLGEVEKRADDLTEASRAAFAEAGTKVESFRASLSEHG